MKKKLLPVLTALLTIGLLAGCGNGAANKKTDFSDVPALKDMDVDQYVTLGDYKTIQVSIERSEVTDEAVDSWVNSYYTTYATEEDGIKDRAVEMGDLIILDYEGKQDGVAFSGGSAQGASLAIGSGQFIPGFEEGLVGVNPGETVDLNLTFPKEYHNADLAGAEVVFTVTVQYILPEKIEDAVVAKMGIEGVSNEAQLRQHIKDMLDVYVQNINESSKQSAVLDAFLNACEYQEFPEKLIAKYEDMGRRIINSAAANSGTTPEQFISVNYNMNLESFLAEYSVEALKQNLAMQAVANRENLNVSDEELESSLNEYAANAGYATVEEYLGETTREDFRESFMFDKVFQYLVENAVVVD